MAHRKPLGTICRTVFDWHGVPPAVGEYLVSQADTWYLVVGVEEKANEAKVGLVLERIARPCEVSDDAKGCALARDDESGAWRVAWPFEWYRREKRG